MLGKDKMKFKQSAKVLHFLIIKQAIRLPKNKPVFSKMVFDFETAEKYYAQAVNFAKINLNRETVVSIEKSLLADPRHTKARMLYVNILRRLGKNTEALEQFRFANSIEQYNKKTDKKRIDFKNPLYQNYYCSYQFDPSFAETTKLSKSRFFNKVLKFAHAACIAGILAFSIPFSLNASNTDVDTKQHSEIGTAILKALIVDKNNENWNELFNAKLYRGSIQPDSLIHEGTLNKNGELLLSDIPTKTGIFENADSDFNVYPVPFNRREYVSFSLNTRSNVITFKFQFAIKPIAE